MIEKARASEADTVVLGRSCLTQFDKFYLRVVKKGHDVQIKRQKLVKLHCAATVSRIFVKLGGKNDTEHHRTVTEAMAAPAPVAL